MLNKFSQIQIKMKKAIITLLIFIPFIGRSQTLTTADLPVAGLGWQTGNDSTYTQAIPAGGTSQNWDYSTLQNLLYDTAGFISSAGTPYASSFPGSNLAGYDQESGTYTYFTTNSSGIYLDGIASPSLFFIYETSQLYFPVPFTYGDVRNTFSRIQIDTVYLGNNARFVLRTNSTFTADGSGNLTLPSGQFNNVIRIKETATTYDSLSLDIGGGIYVPVSNSASQVTRYSFLKPGNPVALILSLEADSLGQFATSSSYFTGTFVSGISNTAEVAKIKTFPNPANTILNIDLRSANDINSIDIFDLKGTLIKNITPDASGITAIDVQDLSTGIYQYSVTGKHTKYSGSFQIQH